MNRKTIETSDGRYNLVTPGEWWDTTGIDIVGDEVVEAYLESNPRVGMVVKRQAGDDA